MRRGPLLNLLATLCLTAVIALVKLVREDLDPFAVVFWRCLWSVIFALPFVGLKLRVVNKPVMLLRILFGFGAMSCFFTVAKMMPLADLTIIMRLQPILVALGAPLLLGTGERVSRLIWVALPLGLLGSGIIIAPGLASTPWFAGALALCAAFFSGGAHLSLRALGRTDDAMVVVFWFHFGGALLAFCASWGTTGRIALLPDAALFPPLMAIGVLALVGQLLMTRAYALERATLVVAASYTGPLYAALFDTLFFAGPPSWRVAIGGALVVGTSLFAVLHRDDRDPRAPAESRV